MARRSVRSIGKQQNDQGSAPDNQDAPAVCPQEEVPDEGLPQAQGKKRKDNDNCATQPRAKKRRGMRGVLSQILDMPYDILIEIFIKLKPEDLLSLMRTSKDLRAFFTNRQNQLVWKAARDHLPGFPECPDDLSEPQYANLAFGKFCYISVCLRRTGHIYTVWTARMKICKRCLPTTFSLSRPSVTSELAPYVPKITVMEPGRGGRLFEKVYSFLGTLEAQYNEAKQSGPDAVEKLVQARKGIYRHSQRCVAWVKDCENQLAQERAALVESRKSTVFEHLRAMGWGEELDKLPANRTNFLRDRPELLKVCQTELTEEGLSKILQILNVHITKFKEERIEHERCSLLRKRVPILQEVIKTYALTLPNSVARELPTFADLFCHPYIRDLIDHAPDEEFTTTGLDPLRDMLPKIVHDVRSTIHDKVVALVAEGYAGSDEFDPKKSLELATTIFSCNNCHYGGGSRIPAYWMETIRYSDVMFHRCANTAASQISTIKRDRRPIETDVNFNYLDRSVNAADWNRYSQISFNPEHKKILSDVVTLAGLDPKTTTSAEMDAIDPIFECIPCNLPSKGRATMRWSVVHVHYVSHVKSMKDMVVSDMKLEVLCEEEAQIARDRMNEIIAREQATDNNSMRCVHCLDDIGHNPFGMKEHVKSKHGILNPTNADIVRRRDFGAHQGVFYMWPPRDE